jgi:hypothetical protein
MRFARPQRKACWPIFGIIWVVSVFRYFKVIRLIGVFGCVRFISFTVYFLGCIGGQCCVELLLRFLKRTGLKTRTDLYPRT